MGYKACGGSAATSASAAGTTFIALLNEGLFSEEYSFNGFAGFGMSVQGLIALCLLDLVVLGIGAAAFRNCFVDVGGHCVCRFKVSYSVDGGGESSGQKVP